jgi:hypothetical protein
LAGHLTGMWEVRNAHRFLVQNLDRRPMRRWEDNIKVDLKERAWDGVNWIHLARDGVQWL